MGPLTAVLGVLSIASVAMLLTAGWLLATGPSCVGAGPNPRHVRGTNLVLMALPITVAATVLALIGT